MPVPAPPKTPARPLARRALLAAAALPWAAARAEAAYPDHPVTLVAPFSAGGAADPLAAAHQAHGIAILTEWDEFKWIDPTEVAAAMPGRHVVDGRNILDRAQWQRNGFHVASTGRSS